MKLSIDNSQSTIEGAKQAFLAERAGEYFWCEREHCLMRRSQCIKNQEVSRGTVLNPYHGVGFGHWACDRASCWGCEQGKGIATKARRHEEL